MDWQTLLTIGAGLAFIVPLAVLLYFHWQRRRAEPMPGNAFVARDMPFTLCLSRQHVQALDSAGIVYPVSRLEKLENGCYALELLHDELVQFSEAVFDVARHRIGLAARARKPGLKGSTLMLGNLAAICQHELLQQQRKMFDALGAVDPKTVDVESGEPLH